MSSMMYSRNNALQNIEEYYMKRDNSSLESLRGPLRERLLRGPAPLLGESSTSHSFTDSEIGSTRDRLNPPSKETP